MDGYIVDSNGYMLEPVVDLSAATKDGDTVNGQTIVVTRCPDGMYKPQWSNGAWVDAQAPSAAELLAQAQQTQIAVLTAARDSAIASAGFTSAADGTSRQYRSDAASQTLMDQLAESIALGIEQYPQAWIAADGTQVQFATVDQAKQFLQDFATAKAVQWAKYMPLQHQVMSATTVADVQAVVWPASN